MNNLNMARLNLYSSRERIEVELATETWMEGLLKKVDWKRKTITIHRPGCSVDRVLEFAEIQAIAPHCSEVTELDEERWGLSRL